MTSNYLYFDQPIITAKDGIVRIGSGGKLKYSNLIWGEGRYTEGKDYNLIPYSGEIYEIITGSGNSIKCHEDCKFMVLHRGRWVSVKAKDLMMFDTVVNCMGNFRVDPDTKEFKKGVLFGIAAGSFDHDRSTESNINFSIKSYPMINMVDYFDDLMFEIYGVNYNYECGIDKRLMDGVDITDSHKEGLKRYHDIDVMNDDIKFIEYANESLVNNLSSFIDFNTSELTLNGEMPVCLNTRLGYMDGQIATCSVWRGNFEVYSPEDITLKFMMEICDTLGFSAEIEEVHQFDGNTMYKLSFPTAMAKHLPLTSKVFHGRSYKGAKFPSSIGDEPGYLGSRHSSAGNVDRGEISRQHGNDYGYDTLDVVMGINSFKNDKEYVYGINTTTGEYSVGGILISE